MPKHSSATEIAVCADPYFLFDFSRFPVNRHQDVETISGLIKDDVTDILATEGVCLLRNFPIEGAEQFSRFVRGLGFDLDDKYQGGAAPRSRIQRAVFNSTEADPAMIISFHTEQCYQMRRSAVIGFYCNIAAQKYGETPVFDAASVFEKLPKSIQTKIIQHGISYRRFFPAHESQLNFQKTWMQAFNTTDRAEVEAILTAESATFEWHADGSLMTNIVMPTAVPDPASGRLCLNINMYEQFTWPFLFDRFKARYGNSERRRIVKFMQEQTQDPTPFLQTRFGDGSEISQAESVAINTAIWDCADMFEWQKGDILLINNVRYGHARLNLVGPREIFAVLASAYDVREMSTNPFFNGGAPSASQVLSAAPSIN